MSKADILVYLGSPDRRLLITLAAYLVTEHMYGSQLVNWQSFLEYWGNTGRHTMLYCKLKDSDLRLQYRLRTYILEQRTYRSSVRGAPICMVANSAKCRKNLSYRAAFPARVEASFPSTLS